MVSWTTNHVALRRMKAEMRFQWMMFLRHRMLLGAAGAGGRQEAGGEGEDEGPATSITPAQMYGGEAEALSRAGWLSHTGGWQQGLS